MVIGFTTTVVVGLLVVVAVHKAELGLQNSCFKAVQTFNETNELTVFIVTQLLLYNNSS